MRTGFVEYLQNREIFPKFIIEEKIQINTHCSIQIIENLSGYQIGELASLNPKTKAKIIDILEKHLAVERKRAATSSCQYNSNRHIALLQALRFASSFSKIKSKKNAT